LIHDAFCVGLTSARKGDALAVNTFMNRDYISDLRQISSALDCSQRCIPRAAVSVIPVSGDVELGRMNGRRRQEQKSSEKRECVFHLFFNNGFIASARL
jgi:hypothetical protein